MRNSECGMEKQEWRTTNGRWQMTNGRWQMADAECQEAEGELQEAGGELKMGDEQCEVQAGGCDEGHSSEPMTEGSSGPVVGHDSNRVIDESTNDENGILSHEGAHAAGQPGQGDGGGQCLPDNVTTPQKAPNTANLGSPKGLNWQERKSEMAGAEGRKQSQSSQGETTRKPRSRDGRPARQSGRRPVQPKAASCFVRRSRKGRTTFPGCEKVGGAFRYGR
jgi:hypothetical protein